MKLVMWWQDFVDTPAAERFTLNKPTSDSFRLKLERAREHLQTLDTETTAWVETEPYKAVDEPDPEPPPQPLLDGYQARRIRIHWREPVPHRLGIVIGDCLFNLRSSLDHLALALANRFTPNMTEQQIRDSEFPVYDSEGRYSKNAPKKIGCMAPNAQLAIEGLQPYQKGDAYKTHPLWQIHNVNIIDKHRALAVCAGFPPDNADWVLLQYNVGEIPYLIGQNASFHLDRPEADAVVCRWAAAPLNPDRDMSMNLKAPVEVAFSEGSLAGKSVVPLLQALCDFIDDSVITPLSKFL